MSDILSQDEVDALLKAVGDGGVAGAGPEATADDGRGGVRTLDLTNQERSLRGRLPGLEVVLGRLVRDLRGGLAPFFGQVPNVTVGAVELLKFGGYMQRLQQPVGLQFWKLAPLRGQGMLVLRPGLVASVMQVLFGGVPGRNPVPAAREFSSIEQRVLARLGGRILADLREAWRPVAPLECTLLRTETNPLFATIAAPHELILHVELQIIVEGSEDVTLAFCIPNGALDPIRQSLARLQDPDMNDEAADTSWAGRLQAVLGEAPVELSAELGTTTLRMGEVLALKVGDVVHLGTGREGPVLVRVAGRPHFHGAPGVSASNNAVRVTARL